MSATRETVPMDLELAQGAGPDPGAPNVASEKDALLAGIEARLTDEVLRLVAVLLQSSGRLQAIGEGIPSGCQFSQFVARSFQLTILQFAHALSKGCHRRVLFDDGAQYLRELGLSLEDAFREVELDGRQFLAVAKIDGRSGQVLDRQQA